MGSRAAKSEDGSGVGHDGQLVKDPLRAGDAPANEGRKGATRALRTVEQRGGVRRRGGGVVDGALGTTDARDEDGAWRGDVRAGSTGEIVPKPDEGATQKAAQTKQGLLRLLVQTLRVLEVLEAGG